MSAPPPTSDIQLLRERKGIVNFDTEISYRALYLAVAEQQLNRSQIACSSVDQRRFRPSQ